MTTTDAAPTAVTPAPRRRRSRNSRAGYWPYMLPGLISFLVVILVPFVLNIWYSLHSWKGGLAPKRWNGLENYTALLADEAFWLSFRNSISMIAAMVVVPTLIGLLLAAMLFDYVAKHWNSQTAAFLRATYYMPQILPISVAGIVWNWILNSQTGAVNTMLEGLGIADPPNWLGDPSLALPSVMLVLIWIQIGYPTVIFMSALQRVEPELYEAAELDGAGWFARFRAITVPQISPETFVIVLTCTIAALKVFAPIYVLTRGGPESSTLVPSYYSYLNFFDTSRVGYGAAVATVLTLIIVVIAGGIQVLQNRSARKDQEGR
ncbi:carbohydrate ABC transporter permease [Brachybacterium sp. GCM10030267]|uniref:carbohydrate ABC transporter permease n=1 Tax=unclassified Brachybacterium TaxID=2623841 RepID=UPI0036118DC5